MSDSRCLIVVVESKFALHKGRVFRLCLPPGKRKRYIGIVGLCSREGEQTEFVHKVFRDSCHNSPRNDEKNLKVDETQTFNRNSRRILFETGSVPLIVQQRRQQNEFVKLCYIGSRC